MAAYAASPDSVPEILSGLFYSEVEYDDDPAATAALKRLGTRWSDPITFSGGELFAYAGRSVDGSEPKYKLPAGFKKFARAI